MGWQSWIGVDLDGTLAHYERFEGPTVIGAPVPAMVDRVKAWLEQDLEVRIFTARADDPEAVTVIQAWCEEHLGQVLTITNQKDLGMLLLYDDRARQVETNTGRLVDP